MESKSVLILGDVRIPVTPHDTAFSDDGHVYVTFDGTGITRHVGHLQDYELHPGCRKLRVVASGDGHRVPVAVRPADS